jgi:hypothetical protein
MCVNTDENGPSNWSHHGFSVAEKGVAGVNRKIVNAG